MKCLFAAWTARARRPKQTPMLSGSEYDKSQIALMLTSRRKMFD